MTNEQRKNEPYIRLAAEILKTAEADFRVAIRTADYGGIKSLKRFYRSKWGQLLSGNHGDLIIERIMKEEAQREQKNRKKNATKRN